MFLNGVRFDVYIVRYIVFGLNNFCIVYLFIIFEKIINLLDENYEYIMLWWYENNLFMEYEDNVYMLVKLLCC